MSDLKLIALRRKRAAAEKANKPALVRILDARIATLENPVAAARPELPKADPWAGLHLTAAARARAEELGLTAEDFGRHRPSGKSGFLVGDVERAARDKANSDEEIDHDGDD